MQILGNLFNVVLFASVVGGAFAAATLVCSRAFRLALPLWAAAAAALLFCVPVLSPDVRLFSPEEQVWLAWYCAASRVWACGAAALLLGQGIRALLASRALRRRPACRDARLRALCARCAAAAGLRRVPDLRSGAGEAAACVAGALRPVVLVNEAALAALAEEEVEAVLLHELTHIRHFDVLWKWISALALCLSWYNPMVWAMHILMGRDLELHCDECVLKKQGITKKSKSEYAMALLSLAEEKSTSFSMLSHFGQSATEERILSIMHSRYAPAMFIGLALLGIAILALLSFLSFVMADGVAFTLPIQ